MTDDMIEAVARAIQSSAQQAGNDSPVDYGDAEGLARAALKAALPLIGEEMAGLVENLSKCRTCGTIFDVRKGHGDEDCPKNYASWDAVDEKNVPVAIRARIAELGERL